MFYWIISNKLIFVLKTLHSSNVVLVEGFIINIHFIMFYSEIFLTVNLNTFYFCSPCWVIQILIMLYRIVKLSILICFSATVLIVMRKLYNLKIMILERKGSTVIVTFWSRRNSLDSQGWNIMKPSGWELKQNGTLWQTNVELRLEELTCSRPSNRDFISCNAIDESR